MNTCSCGRNCGGASAKRDSGGCVCCNHCFRGWGHTIWCERRNLKDILRADIAAVSDDNLDDDISGYSAISIVQDPSQVYSIRMPVDRIEEVRLLAQNHEIPPSIMLR